MRVRVAGEERWAAVEDAGRLRDALGTPLPVGIPDAFLEPVATRSATWSPATPAPTGRSPSADVAARLGLGPAVVEQALARLAAAGRVVEGSSGPAAPAPSGATPRCCARCGAGRSPRCARRSSRCRPRRWPVPAGLAARRQPAARSLTGVLRVVEQLQGAPVPASALESLVLPARVPGYSPAMLDELCRGGRGALGAGTARCPAATAGSRCTWPTPRHLTLPAPVAEAVATPVHQAVARRARRRRRVLLPAAVRRRRRGRRAARRAGRRPGPGRDAVGPGLGRPRQQRHPRSAARPGRRRWRCAQGSPGRAARSLRPRSCRRCRAAPGRPSRPAAGRCCPRSRPTPPGEPHAAGRAAARPARRGHPRRGRRRARAGRLRRGLPGARRVRGDRAVPPRLLRRGAGRRPVRAAGGGRPAACRRRLAGAGRRGPAHRRR